MQKVLEITKKASSYEENHTINFYPALTGSNTPTSKCGGSKEVRWEINCP